MNRYSRQAILFGFANLVGLVNLVSSSSWANDLSGQMDAQWGIDRQWSATDSDQPWIPAHNWQSDLSAQVSLFKNGFGLATTINDKTATLDELFYDFSTANAEWTLGRKPQEWAYGYNQNALNWINQETIVLREQYVPIGSWQSWCYLADNQSDSPSHAGCATRASGWLGAADWQVMLGYQDYWRAGLGLQTQLGAGGLSYMELYASEHESLPSLAFITDDIVKLNLAKDAQTQVNLGAQWTTSFSLTVHAEIKWLANGLSANDWQAILRQLPTPQAGLVADAFNQPISKTQAMLRLAMPWHEFNFENVSILWPEADNSLLNQFSAELNLTPTLSMKASWQHNMQGHVLRRIGQQDQISVTFQFLDGF